MEDLYSIWFKENHNILYSRYGDCWLIIDNNSLEVIASYKKDEVKESINHYYQGVLEQEDYIHQECCEEIKGFTTFSYSPFIIRNNANHHKMLKKNKKFSNSFNL